MIKYRLDNGLYYYKLDVLENNKMGGLCICDYCNSLDVDGYLVPVLNSYLCKKCFYEWQKDCVHYPEDDEIEKEIMKEYESIDDIEVLDRSDENGL